MKSEEYWRIRSLERMDMYHKDSDRVIGRVLEAYQAAIEDIAASMDRTLGIYAKNGNMSREEALQRLTNIESREVLRHLEGIIASITDEKLRAELLSRINAPAYRARLTRLEAVKETLNAEINRIADVQVREMDKGLYNTAQTAYYMTMFDMHRRTGYGFTFAAMPEKRIQEVLKNIWSGKHYSTRIWGNADAMSVELEHVLTKGMMSGASVRKMSKEISERMNVGMYNATRLIRTETTYVANASELAAYKEAGVERLEYLATLDTRTSDICRRHDGIVIPVEKAVPGKNIPPLHANCRSTTLEVFEDDNLAELKRRARDPVTGKSVLVPANMNYNDWHQKYVTGSPKALASEKKIKNKASDKTQHAEYKKVLGKDVPKSFDKFQELKYNDVKAWDTLKANYAETNRFNKIVQESAKLNIKGKVVKNIDRIDISDFDFAEFHIASERGRNVTKNMAQDYINSAVVAYSRWNGEVTVYVSKDGCSVVNLENKIVSTAYKSDEYDDKFLKILEVIESG